MLFDALIRRRLEALLRPWVRDDQQLQLNLGFLRSTGELENVTLNSSALNELLDDPSRFCFKEVTIDHLSLQFSPFSSSAFTLVVRGLRVVLSLGEEEDELGMKWRRKWRDKAVEERNKVLREIDPEGCVLHDAIKNISQIAIKTWRTSFLNTVIKHCCLQLYDVHVTLQSPRFKDPFSCSLYMKRLGAASQVKPSCFLVGLMGSFFVAFPKSTLFVDVDCFEIGLNRERGTACVVFVASMVNLFTLSHLQFTAYSIEIPAIKFAICPLDLSALLLFYESFLVEHKPARNGRLLWSIVSARISSLFPSSKQSLVKTIRTVCMWLRYIKTYESLLLRLGYPAHDTLRRSVQLMSRDTTYSIYVKSQWNLVSELENCLPFEAIGVGRRIIRARTASSEPRNDGNFHLLASLLSKLFLLSLFFQLIRSFFISFMKALSLHKVMFTSSGGKSHVGSVPENGLLQHSFSLNVREIMLSVSPENSVQASFHRKSISHWRKSQKNLISFHFCVDEFFMRYHVSILEYRLTFACEQLNVVSSSAGKAVASSSSDQDVKQKPNKVVVQSESAGCACSDEASSGHTFRNIKGTSISRLENLLEKLWCNWDDFRIKSEAAKVPNARAPWILCEMGIDIADVGGIGYSTCFNGSVVIGKLNFRLDYDSLVACFVIFRLLQCSPYWSRREKTTEYAPGTVVGDSYLRCWGSNLETYSSKLQMEIVRRIPDRSINFGALIAGPHIVISLSNGYFTHEANSLYNMHVLSSFDISNIEFLVSPTVKENVGLSDEGFTKYDIEPESSVPEDPRSNFPESDNGAYTCQGKSSHSIFLNFIGLKSYYGQNSGIQKDEIIIVQPAKLQFKLVRKFHHSLGSSVVFVSVAAHLDAAEIFVLIFLDELSQLMKMIFEVSHESLGFPISGAGDDHRMEAANPESGFGRKLYIQSKQNAPIITAAEVVLKCNFGVKSFHFFLHDSRKGLGVKTNVSEKPGSITTDVILENDETSCNGIHFSIQSSLMQSMYQEGNFYVVVGAHGVQFVLSRYLPKVDVTSDGSELRNVLRSLSPLTEASARYCTLSLNLKLPSAKTFLRDNGSRHHETVLSQRVFPVTVDQRRAWDHLCMMNLAISGVCVAERHLKDTFAHEWGEFNSDVFIGSEYEEISCECECKGGFILLEASALRMLIDCSSSYYQRFLDLASRPFQVIATQHARNTAPSHGYPSANLQHAQLPELLLKTVKAFSLRLLGPSIILVERHESGRVQELQLEVNIECHLELLDTVNKFSFMLSKLSVLSQSTHENSEFNPQRQQSLSERFQHYVVKNIQCSISIEGHVGDRTDPALLNSIWTGQGSVSEFDMVISLDEIKMILSGYDALSKVGYGEDTFKVDSNEGLYNQEPAGNMAEIVPDGAIVAIQDADQHMYIAVEGAESRYKVAGAIHYSLVAEQALFRIKYQKTRIWRSEVQYFSLISLYAKDRYGESLRLNCDAGSRFVGISCSNDNVSALWRVLPYKSDAYENAIEMEYSASLSRKSFHLVNKKNDFSVAFNNGILEFVSKPGNLFKWKVFRDPIPFGSNPMQNPPLVTLRPKPESRKPQIPGAGTILHDDSDTSENLETTTNKKHLGILVVVDKVRLTVVHKLGSEENIPLLQGSIMPNQIIIQFSNSKVRVMNLVEVNLCYFNGRQNSWKDFIQPIEICSFYSQKFIFNDAEGSHGVPKHFYARTGEVCVLLTELSLDILLFIIGKLDLAGPYAVKGSAVLGNCCKVENKSGLTLVCQFYDNQEVLIHARELTTVFLRHLALANQPVEASFFSAQLVKQGFSTHPIRLSLLEDRLFSWRTRIMAVQDAKSYPGPCIAFEISKGVEDVLFISISPLLTIHNNTDFLLELCFQRPHEETESASIVLKAGDVIDDTMLAFSAIDLPGGLRKIFASLGLGNYLFSFRPKMGELERNSKISVEWSDDLKGGKPVRVSGLFDKLSYQMRKALSIDSFKSSLRTINCALISDKRVVTNLYFLIQTVGKSIPVVNPDNAGYSHSKRNPVAVQEQKELFVLPTIQVSNLLETEVHVSLTDADPPDGMEYNDIWNQATIECGSTVNFYANPDTIYFTVTLSSFGLSCKPTNSSDWLKKSQKQKGEIPHLDVELNFGGGNYSAFLRLSRGQRGTLKACIFTSYALKNDINVPLLCLSPKQKPLSRVDVESFGTNIPLDLGLYLPPKATMSWFLRSHKVHFMLLEENTMEAQLDFDLLSGVTQIDLETEDAYGSKNTMRLGVSVRPLLTEKVPSQIVSLSSRYILFNDSETVIAVRQFYVEDTDYSSEITSKQRIALRLKKVTRKDKTTNVIDRMLRKHTKLQDDLSLFLQFRPVGAGLGWSGPVCVASLGRFFVRFRKSSGFSDSQSGTISNTQVFGEHAFVHVKEEGTTITLHFHWPPPTDTPYRIENCLRDAPITYYQKGSYEPDILGVGASANYVWDDLTLPHKLVIKSDDMGLLHDINLDKVRSWKPFRRNHQSGSFPSYNQSDKSSEDQRRNSRTQLMASDTLKLGYEVYADGLTRVLRICEFSESFKMKMVLGSGRKLRLRISYFSIHLLELAGQVDLSEQSEYAPLIVAKLERINWNADTVNRYKYIQLGIQSLSIDEKWVGAPFSAMLRQHRSEKSDVDDYIIRVAMISLPSSNVRQVKSLSVVLQPLDLNLDEETLMKVVPFWRRSLSDSKSPYKQYYFDHLEISPIKIVASFLPGDSRYRYSSAQETLRSFLHSVIKVPEIKRKTVELNGVLVTHALITLPELALKCAQHYSWYVMRAVYIAKGSPLLPPDFVSIFDDLASSSLDIFFDPSSGFLGLPSVTLGTLKLVSKFIDKKGFSGTKRYFGDLGNTLKTAGSNVLFAAVTEVSDSVLKGAEASGFNGMLTGFHQGMLKLAMEPHVLSSAFMQGGPDQRIKLERSPGIDELYIEGYLQAMLDTQYKQEYLRVRVLDDQVILKNLPPSTVLIDEIMANVKGFLASKSLLKGESSMSLRHIHGEGDWRIGPTLLTLCEHLFVSFAIRMLRKQSSKVTSQFKWKPVGEKKALVVSKKEKTKQAWKWRVWRFALSGVVAYIDGRLCRNIPHPLARRIVSGFLLSFLDQRDDEDDGDKSMS